MFLDNISKLQSYSSRLTITKPTFLHIIPDFTMDVIDSVLTLDLGLNNCQSIYIKTSPIKFGNKQINPKMYFYKLKERQDLPITLVQSLPAKIPEHKYVIVDHSILAQGVNQLLEQEIPINTVSQILFEKLKEEHLLLKSKYPNIENVMLFNFSPSTDDKSLASVVLNRNIKPEVFKCFDTWVLGAVTAESQKTTYIPIANYDTKGNVELLTSNFNKIHEIIANAHPIPAPIVVDNKNIKAKDVPPPEQQEIQSQIADKLADAFVHAAEKDQEDQIYRAVVELDKKKLSKALKGFQIKDPVVANNIKIAIDQYLINQEGKSVDKSDMEKLILKSIHFSLFATDDVPEEYYADPNKLISKLLEMNTFVREITYPEVVHTPQLISPGDVINFHRVTGVGRHKYELSQNLDFAVRTLFQSLENRKINPIKVLKIKSEITDNNIDRMREYTITVKNLSAGFKEPYDLKLRIPALVNDYYFKLNGQNYILNNQMYLKPITKDKDGEARFLSHYNMVTLKIVNVKFNVSQINDILNYIRLKYSQNCKKIDIDDAGNVTRIEFLDGTIIEPGSNTPFSNEEKEIIFDDGDYKIHDIKLDKLIDLHIPKNEYIFQELIYQIQKLNPDEKLNKSAKSIPYIQIHAMGRQLPLIVFLWQQIGLIETLVRYNVNYEVGEKPTKQDNNVELPLEQGKFIFIYPETKRQELLVNGLLQLPKNTTLTEESLSSRNALDDIINSKYGNRTTFSFNLMMDNIIDHTTKDLLEFEEQPTNFIDILNGPLIDKLLNDTPDHPSDLKTLRLRQAEVLTNILYSEIAMSINKYNTDLSNGVSDAKLYFHPDYVTAMLLGKHVHSESSDTAGGIMDFNVTFSPVDELIKTSKTVKTGPGGVI